MLATVCLRILDVFEEKHGDFITYCEAVFAKFFAREFAADDANEVAQLIKTMGLRKDDFP